MNDRLQQVVIDNLCILEHWLKRNKLFTVHPNHSQVTNDSDLYLSNNACDALKHQWMRNVWAHCVLPGVTWSLKDNIPAPLPFPTRRKFKQLLTMMYNALQPMDNGIQCWIVPLTDLHAKDTGLVTSPLALGRTVSVYSSNKRKRKRCYLTNCSVLTFTMDPHQMPKVHGVTK